MSTIVEQKAKEIIPAESRRVEKKKHDEKKQSITMYYAYACLTESINVSALEGNALLKQEQAGARDASKLEAVINQFNAVLLTKTNNGSKNTYTITVEMKDGPFRKLSKHHLVNKPVDKDGGWWIDQGYGTFKWMTLAWIKDSRLAGPAVIHTNRHVIPIKTTQILALDEKNDNMTENRDYFRGQLTKVQQGQMLIGNNVSTLASSVSQETNQGMNCIHLMEKAGVQIAKSMSNKKQK